MSEPWKKHLGRSLPTSVALPKRVTLRLWNGSRRTKLPTTASPGDILITSAWGTGSTIRGPRSPVGLETLYLIPGKETLAREGSCHCLRFSSAIQRRCFVREDRSLRRILRCQQYRILGAKKTSSITSVRLSSSVRSRAREPRALTAKRIGGKPCNNFICIAPGLPSTAQETPLVVLNR